MHANSSSKGQVRRVFGVLVGNASLIAQLQVLGVRAVRTEAAQVKELFTNCLGTVKNNALTSGPGGGAVEVNCRVDINGCWSAGGAGCGFINHSSRLACDGASLIIKYIRTSNYTYFCQIVNTLFHDLYAHARYNLKEFLMIMFFRFHLLLRNHLRITQFFKNGTSQVIFSLIEAPECSPRVVLNSNDTLKYIQI